MSGTMLSISMCSGSVSGEMFVSRQPPQSAQSKRPPVVKIKLLMLFMWCF